MSEIPKEGEMSGIYKCVDCGRLVDTFSQEVELIPDGARKCRCVTCVVEQRDQFDARRKECIIKYEKLREDHLKPICSGARGSRLTVRASSARLLTQTVDSEAAVGARPTSVRATGVPRV